MINRREFIINSSWLTGVGLVSPKLFLGQSNDVVHLTILHTNDQHSRIEPFPDDGGRYANRGGMARRATVINAIRKEQEHVLLFDCGDMIQGTPYFNEFGGEVELKLMEMMGYDAAILGNHDFDGGVSEIASHMRGKKIDFISSNYRFDNEFEEIFIPYKIYDKGGVKVGVYALGIELDGLVPDYLIDGTFYDDPVKVAIKAEEGLKERGCDLIICLSHLGFRYDGGKVDDISIAKETNYTHFIFGGHTHTFLKSPEQVINKKGHKVFVHQAGWAGLEIGRVDITFCKGTNDIKNTCENILI